MLHTPTYLCTCPITTTLEAGGVQILHKLVPSTSGKSSDVVCKSIASQMSHFLELNRNWRYDKREDIGPGHPDMKTYSYVLMEANATHIALLKDSHVPLAFIQGYSNMTLNAFWFPFFSITLGDKLLLLERVPDPEHPITPVISQFYELDLAKEPHKQWF
ncbi:unnamed protein product [Oncorhynchus mykiss]|uniref:Uncharacterized protein n=1 Tax=Oncorhynchus mykiss TaxID=8022 RepID=A0A060X7D0_ONCMY|nr:unnamed protein product [Oncorhynchus mykiss]